jgi:ribosomal protein L16 Arg81 hydroxylase
MTPYPHNESSGLFGALIGPITEAQFLDQYWEKRALFIRGSAEKTGLLQFSLERVYEILSRCPAGAATIRAQFFDRGGVHREFEISPQQVRNVYSAGMSVQISNMERLHPPIMDALNAIKRELNHPGRMYASVFLSPPSAGYGQHFDRDSIMTLQVEGSKTWNHDDGPVLTSPTSNIIGSDELTLNEFRLRNPWASIQPPEPARMIRHDLQPGDILYLPGGTWHGTEARQDSLSVGIGFNSITSLEMIAQLLMTRLSSAEAWRIPIPQVKGSPESIKAFLRERLAELQSSVREMSMTDIARVWQMVSGQPQEGNVFEEAGVAPLVNPADRLRRIASISLTTEIEDDEQVLVITSATGTTVSVAPVALPLVRAIQQREEFTASDAVRWTGDDEEWDWEDVNRVLDSFIRAGFLRHDSPSPSQAGAS